MCSGNMLYLNLSLDQLHFRHKFKGLGEGGTCTCPPTCSPPPLLDRSSVLISLLCSLSLVKNSKFSWLTSLANIALLYPPQTISLWGGGRYIGSPCLSICLSIHILSGSWIIFHTIVVHNLDPRSYLQGQGHSAHIPQIPVRAKCHTAKLDLDNISHNCCP